MSAFSANVYFFGWTIPLRNTIYISPDPVENLVKSRLQSQYNVDATFKYIKENKLAVLVEQSYNLVCFVTLMSCILPTCQLHFPFCLFVFFLSSFFMALFPFQRTNSTNWWTVGSRVRLNHNSEPPLLSPEHPTFHCLSLIICLAYMYIFSSHMYVFDG